MNDFHQCSNGGLRIDENAQTSLHRLYAVGEASAGSHGADRLAGHMMATSHVFGVRAAKHAAAIVKAGGLPRLPEGVTDAAIGRIEAVSKGKGDQKPSALIEKLQRTAWEDLLVVRSKDSLNRVLREITQIGQESVPRLAIDTPSEMVAALELENLLLVGEVVARASLMRAESRGPHYREDFPRRDDANWLRAITIKKLNGEMHLEPIKLDDHWVDRPGDLGPGRWG